MALRSTQPLTEMSTRSISWRVKSGRCVRLTTYHHPVPLSRNLGTSTSWNPLGLFKTVTGLFYLYRDKKIEVWDKIQHLEIHNALTQKKFSFPAADWCYYDIKKLDFTL